MFTLHLKSNDPKLRLRLVAKRAAPGGDAPRETLAEREARGRAAYARLQALGRAASEADCA